MSKSLLKEFAGKNIHILGVAGTLMGSFAAAMRKKGLQVTGSDQNIYPPMSDVLKNAGVPVYIGYKPENLTAAKPDLVIVGNVIRKTNIEMEEVVKLNIPFLSLPAAFETMILPQKHSLVMAGTHGKTTTSTILAHILEGIGENPSFFIGGVPLNFTESFRVTDSKYMVLEGDEYDTAYFDKVPKFTHYRPSDAILTSIEFDHADIYKDVDAVIAAFEKLAKLIPASGSLITCIESELAMKVSKLCAGKVISYGFDKAATSQGTDLKLSESGISFQWKGHHVTLSAPGRHNALNTLACLTLCEKLGLPLDKAVASLKTFSGVKRRQEVYYTKNDIYLIDDFAHHPTAVRETLQAIHSKYPKHRIFACFEPRSATSRRKIFQEDYAKSFDVAHEVFIAKPYDQSSINATEQFSSEELISDISARGKKASIFTTTEESIQSLAKQLKPGDLVLVMSNGSFDGLLPKLTDCLKKI